MGSPFGPLLINIFLSHHEKIYGLIIVLQNLNRFFYRRYVDDSFILFQSRNHIEPFLNFLNSRHPNMKFTFDVETNKTLSFLDIKICHSHKPFVTSVYRKPTFIGLFTNFESFLPIMNFTKSYDFNFIYSPSKTIFL